VHKKEKALYLTAPTDQRAFAARKVSPLVIKLYNRFFCMAMRDLPCMRLNNKEAA